MIGSLSGTFVEVNNGDLLLDVGGVGYEIAISGTVLASLPRPQTALTLYTHLVVREDAQNLYGFASRPERDVFRSLIRVNGIGPKLALGLLSALSIQDLAVVVQRREVSRLTAVSGVGKKTAERLLVELKDKLDVIGIASCSEARSLHAVETDQGVSVALDAMLKLGYRQAEASALIEQVRVEAGEDCTSEQLVRLALRRYARVQAGGVT